MSWAEFLPVFLICALTMLLCRVAPMMLLKGKRLPVYVENALKLIPPAAFAALVANDLFTPGMFDAGFWPAAVPLCAAIVVVFVAIKSKSLLLCAVSGVVAFALLLMI